MTPAAQPGRLAAEAAGAGSQPTVSTEPRGRGVAAGMPRTAKLIRIGVMARELLDEARRAPLDQAGQARLRHVFDASMGELSACLPPKLAAELDRLFPPMPGDGVGQSELLVAQAQLAGWLEGLFQTMQASLDAQRATLLQALVEGAGDGREAAEPGPERRERSGAYL